MINPINIFLATLPAIVPWATFFLLRAAENSDSITRRTWDSHYDYIIVGAGSAGSVIANRLSEDPTVKVLLLEVGGSESAVTDIPSAIWFLQETPIDWNYRTVPQTHCCSGIEDRMMKWPRGKVLGGSSTINYMMYIRGNPRDYDIWERLGAKGWSYKNVLPYFMKSEDNRIMDIAFNGYHGRNGPLTVERAAYTSPLANAFLEAGKLFGYPVADINGPSQLGFTIAQATLRRGARCSTAKAFLRSARDRNNLHVIVKAFVTKILINQNKEAYGVVFDRFGSTHQVFANKEVIISGGTINSAQLLMLSGIGPKEELEHHGIPVVADLPVGKHLIDHYFPYGLNFIADRNLKPVNERWTIIQNEVQTIPNILLSTTLGRGPVSSMAGQDAYSFVRTRFANSSMPEMPDFEFGFLSACLTSDGGRSIRRRAGINDLMWQQAFEPMVGEECFSIIPIIMKPKSVGYIKLFSANPYDYPLINPRYFSHPDDLESMAEAMLLAFKLLTSEPFVRKFNSRPSDLVVPGCEQYPLYGRSYMKCMAQTLTSTMYHPVGTCKMGAHNDPTAVVDPELRVRGGIKRLRVADGSIMPEITSGNTNAPIIMIGERVSDFIKGYKTFTKEFNVLNF